MNETETFFRVNYVVVWRGCPPGLTDRWFDEYDEAEKLWRTHIHQHSKIERIAIKIRITDETPKINFGI